MIPFFTRLIRLFFFFILICSLPAIANKGGGASLTTINCSADKYTAKINEVNLGQNQFIEIYFINTITTSNWDICYLNDSGAEICSSITTRTPPNGSHSSGDFVVFTLPSDMDKKDGEILLKDNNGDAIDSLTYCISSSCTNALWDFNNSCTTTLTNHAVGQTDIFRDPDGTGNFDNNKTTTKGCSNSGCGGGGGGDTAATNFNCVEHDTDGISGKLFTKTTEQSFSFDIVALRDASTIETSFASGGDHTVTVELVNAETAAACDSYPALAPAVSQSLTLISSDSGIKASAAMGSNTAYKAVKCRVTDTTDSPSVIGCSTDSFAIRPTAFTISSNLTNTDSTGTPKAKAGENFTLTATATTGYNGTPAINNTNMQAHAGAVQTGSISGAFNAAAPATGTATGTAFSYSEVGLLRFITEGIYDDSFTAIDQSNDCTDDFSNTVDGNGKVGCKFGNTAISDYFGRFTPDHFVLSNKNFEDRINLSCPSDSIFSYIGEAFQTRFTVTAENSSNNTTQNYTSSYAKLSASDLNFGAIDLADAVTPTSATALSSQLSLVSTSGSWTNGVANMTANLGVTRSSPAGPFESFKLGIAPTDSDSITLSSYDLDTSVPSDSNDVELLASTTIRFGRLTIENAHGSELLTLAVPMQTEYYNGSHFVSHSDDSCTPINVSQLNFNGGTNPITVASATSTASITNSPLALGLAGLSLSAPGANNTGFIDITSSTLIASYPWLSYDWDGDGSHDNSPSARATFGIYKGNTRQIYFREVY